MISAKVMILFYSLGDEHYSDEEPGYANESKFRTKKCSYRYANK